MGLKKYEIITVGSDRRVRALRSWQVGDRYVNIGDVGGIVYDEKTLSQDGACWLFRGNFGFPGARIGGDSIVDVGEAAIDANGSSSVDILGSSVVVGSKVNFTVGAGAVDGMTLSAADFEQGDYMFVAGAKPENQKVNSPAVVRIKSPIFMGGVSKTLKLNVPGYAVQAFGLDADLVMVSATANTVTGAGVTLVVPAAQYCLIRLRKDPVAATVPADAAAAKITFTASFDTKLVVVDSRLEVNPVTSTGTVSIRSGGLYPITPGAKYPDSVIRNSKVVINGHATANQTVRLISEFTGCNVAIDATSGDSQGVGIYSNVKNLTFTGAVTASWNVSARSSIQATDCDNFVVSPTIFPGMAAAQAANTPFIFQGCNVPNGIFYHHVQIANTYKNIDFAKASVDLGKSVPGVAYTLVSSETEGMYRVYNTAADLLGFLVESYDSISSIGLLAATATSYGTTIYKNAYVKGKFDFAGTNVFGNTKKHDTSNTQDVSGVLVKGLFNATTNGSTISGIADNNARAVVAQPFRVSGAGGVSVSSPAGVECNIYLTDAANKIIVNTGYVSGTNAPIVPALPAVYAYVAMKKTDGSDILSTDEFKGVTVTVYNGCKIVNTGATAVNMKGNIRVEDNAILVNASVTGTGYFGDNSVVYYNPAVWAALAFYGTVHMKGNAVFAPTALTGACALVHMEGNAKFIGSVTVPSTSLSFIMGNNAIIEGKANTRSGVVMSGNSRVAPTGIIADTSRGSLVMKDNASIEANTIVIGAITLAGNYKGDVVKTWVGKRTITDVNEPEYDNNVKSKYDL